MCPAPDHRRHCKKRYLFVSSINEIDNTATLLAVLKLRKAADLESGVRTHYCVFPLSHTGIKESLTLVVGLCPQISEDVPVYFPRVTHTASLGGSHLAPPRPAPTTSCRVICEWDVATQGAAWRCSALSYLLCKIPLAPSQQVGCPPPPRPRGSGGAFSPRRPGQPAILINYC